MDASDANNGITIAIGLTVSYLFYGSALVGTPWHRQFGPVGKVVGPLLVVIGATLIIRRVIA
jgi:hypothetical protein